MLNITKSVQNLFQIISEHTSRSCVLAKQSIQILIQDVQVFGQNWWQWHQNKLWWQYGFFSVWFLLKVWWWLCGWAKQSLPRWTCSCHRGWWPVSADDPPCRLSQGFPPHFCFSHHWLLFPRWLLSQVVHIPMLALCIRHPASYSTSDLMCSHLCLNTVLRWWGCWGVSDSDRHLFPE